MFYQVFWYSWCYARILSCYTSLSRLPMMLDLEVAAVRVVSPVMLNFYWVLFKLFYWVYILSLIEVMVSLKEESGNLMYLFLVELGCGSSVIAWPTPTAPYVLSAPMAASYPRELLNEVFAIKGRVLCDMRSLLDPSRELLYCDMISFRDLVLILLSNVLLVPLGLKLAF